MKWYKRLLCGYNLFGDFAHLVCRGTEITRGLTPQERKASEIEIRCWCCTFWRGVVLGATAAVVVLGGLYALA